MSEEKIVSAVNEALAAAEIEDTVVAAGEFNPRGHSGAGFAGGLIGDSLGTPADSVATVGGYMVGTRVHDAASGLPGRMVVGVLETTVYGSQATAPTPRLSPSACRVTGSKQRFTSASTFGCWN